MILNALASIFAIFYLVCPVAAGVAYIFNNCKYIVAVYSTINDAKTSAYLSPGRTWNHTITTNTPSAHNIFLTKLGRAPRLGFSIDSRLAPQRRLYYGASVSNCLPRGIEWCAGADGGVVIEPNDVGCNAAEGGRGRVYCPASDLGKGCWVSDANATSLEEWEAKMGRCENVETDVTLTLCSG